MFAGFLLDSEGFGQTPAGETRVRRSDFFLGVAAKAKDILANSESEWQRLAPRIGVSDNAGLEIYRRRYSEGIPRRPIRDEERDAIGLYRVLADIGGAELVGPARELDKGTFYDPERSD